MPEIPEFLKGLGGLIVDSASNAQLQALNLSRALQGSSHSETTTPADLPAYLRNNGLAFAVFGAIRLADKEIILRTIQSGFPTLYVPTQDSNDPEWTGMYDAFDKAGAVPVSRRYSTESIVYALTVSLGRHFIHRK